MRKSSTANIHYRYVYLVRYLQAWCAFQEKDYDAALRGFVEVQDKTNDTELRKLAFFQVAETFYRAGRYSEAEKNYSDFLNQYPNDFLKVPALYGLGWSIEKQTNYARAAETFSRIVNDNPQHSLASWAAVREGADAYACGDLVQSRQAYTKALQFSSGQSPADLAEFGLGWLDFSDKKYSDALTHFLKVSLFLPESQLHWDAEYLEAGSDYLLGDYVSAKKIYTQCTENAPADMAAASLYWLSWCNYSMGEYEIAFDHFQKLSETEDETWTARADWGRAESACQLGNYDGAIQGYQDSLKVTGCPITSECYSGLGWSYFKLGKYAESYQAFQKVIEINSQSPLAFEAQLRSGDCQYNLHEFAIAEKEYEKVVNNHDGSPYELDALEQLGWCAYRQEDFTKAIQEWEDLIQTPGTDERKPRLLYWTAWAYFRDKQFDKSAEQFKAVE